MTATAPTIIDVLDPAFRVNSAPVRDAAARSWYAQTPLGPAILSYEDCTALLHDRRVRQASSIHLAEQGVTEGPVAQMWRSTVFTLDGLDHARLRRLAAPAFTPAAVDRLRERMRAIVDELVDAFAADGRCEFVSAFADHYPPRVIFELLGIPAEDHRQFLAWGKELAHLLGYEVPAHHDDLVAAIEGIGGIVDELLARRRREPGPDLISALVAASEGEDRLSEAEIRSMVVLLVMAGQDSTRCSLGNALTLFAEHPDQWTLLARRPELAPAAVEEVLRVRPVSPLIWRMAHVDLDHKDLHITAGTRIWLMVGNAQRTDSDGNLDPFDITAEHRPQLNFGHGTHFCLGAQLARAELAEALAILSHRMPSLVLDGDPIHRPELAGFIGPDRLPIRFTPTSV